MAGLIHIVHRPQAVMLVPQPGPGLWVAGSGAVIIVISALADRAVTLGAHTS